VASSFSKQAALRRELQEVKEKFDIPNLQTTTTLSWSVISIVG